MRGPLGFFFVIRRSQTFQSPASPRTTQENRFMSDEAEAAVKALKGAGSDEIKG
jgi:hypothetical protein